MENLNEVLQQHGQRRRDFIRHFVKFSVAAPAAVLLLSQSTITQAAFPEQEPTETQPTPSSSSNPT